MTTMYRSPKNLTKKTNISQVLHHHRYNEELNYVFLEGSFCFIWSYERIRARCLLDSAPILHEFAAATLQTKLNKVCQISLHVAHSFDVVHRRFHSNINYLIQVKYLII